MIFAHGGTFFRFALVGGFNTIVDFGLHNLFIFVFGKGGAFEQTIYQAVSFFIANLSSFFLNRSFTFKQGGSYVKFFTISVLTLLFSMLATYILNLWYNQGGSIIIINIIKLSTIAISLMMNFIGYRLLVFTHKKED